MKRRGRPAFYLDITNEELWLLEHGGAEVADRWHESLWKTIEFLEQHPFLGRQRHDLRHSGIRSWRINGFERWLIFYRIHDDALVLFRVVSGTMNLSKLLFE